VFKVMIVDDEPIFRQYMQTRLNWSELDMHVCCEAKHGIDALEQAEIHRPDIALIDINMPYMDGLQLSERLKSRYPDISIVLVTGHNEFEYARTALRIGVNDYLLKPFDKEEFQVTLHKVKFFLKAVREERAMSKDHSHLIAGQGDVIWYERMAIDQNNFVVFPVELHENLIFRLRLKDLNGVQEQLELAFSYLNTNRSSADHAYTILMGLLSLCLSFAIESGHSIVELFGEGFSPYQEMHKMASIEQCQEWLRELFQRVIVSSSGNRLSKSAKLYEAAKEFIHTHYADPDLSVDGIAGHLYIDASYLRKIFKREGDMPVSDYLTYIRMQKAKKLISGNQLKLIDIAEKTGYRDPGYFSKCFKKQFGVTPTVYENRNRT
jgi:two-component system response regulator YesN